MPGKNNSAPGTWWYILDHLKNPNEVTMVQASEMELVGPGDVDSGTSLNQENLNFLNGTKLKDAGSHLQNVIS